MLPVNLWLVAVWREAGEDKGVVTVRRAGENVAAKAAEFVGLAKLAKPDGDPPTLPRPSGAEHAEETSYRTKSGIRVGAFVQHGTEEEYEAVEAAASEWNAKIGSALAESKIQLAAQHDRSKSEAIERARGALLHSAMVALHETFEQQTKND